MLEVRTHDLQYSTVVGEPGRASVFKILEQTLVRFPAHVAGSGSICSPSSPLWPSPVVWTTISSGSRVKVCRTGVVLPACYLLRFGFRIRSAAGQEKGCPAMKGCSAVDKT